MERIGVCLADGDVDEGASIYVIAVRHLRLKDGYLKFLKVMFPL